MFNSIQANKTSSQNHLGTILDEPLLFEEHLKTISVDTNINYIFYTNSKIF